MDRIGVHINLRKDGVLVAIVGSAQIGVEADRVESTVGIVAGA